jgi:hypothetical protein
MLQNVFGKFEFLSNDFSAKKAYFSKILYLQNVCGKFKLLSNNCLTKKAYFSLLLYRQKCLWKVIIFVKQLFGEKRKVYFSLLGKKVLFIHDIVQEICFKMSLKSLNYCQTIVWRKRRIFPCYCTDKMSVKSYNFCQTIVRRKKVHFSMILYRKYASKCLWKVWILVKQLFDEKGVFLHDIVPEICFKMYVESLHSCQTTFRRKKRISPKYCTFKMSVASLNYCQTIVTKKAYFSMQYASKCLWKVWNPVKRLFGEKSVFLHAILQAIWSQISKKLLVVANNLSNVLLPELKIWSDLSQANNLQKCIQIADILWLFLLLKYLLPKCKKKVLKSLEISRQLPVHL